MDVPVPVAKQLLQGSSSLLNLSHLLLVFRHWSQALLLLFLLLASVGCCSSSVKSKSGRGGSTDMGRKKEEVAAAASCDACHAMQCTNQLLAPRSQSRPCPGSWLRAGLGKKCGAMGPLLFVRLYLMYVCHAGTNVVQSPFLIFIFHRKRMLMGHVPMPPCSQYPSYRDRFAQSCIVPSVLWDARVAK